MNNNAVIPVSDPVPDSLNIHERIRRGQAIANLYIAAQHLSQLASDEACRLIEDANDRWQNYGFNQRMRRSPFPTRAQGFPTHNQFVPTESETRRAERLRRMTTPPWGSLGLDSMREDILLNGESFSLIPIR